MDQLIRELQIGLLCGGIGLGLLVMFAASVAKQGPPNSLKRGSWLSRFMHKT